MLKFPTFGYVKPINLTMKLNYVSCGRRLFIALAATLTGLGAGAQSAPVAETPTPKQQKMLQRQPLLFMENKGQVKDIKGSKRQDVIYTAKNAGAQLFITASTIYYQFTKTENDNTFEQVNGNNSKQRNTKSNKLETYRFSVQLLGSNPSPEILSEKQNIYVENYYLSNCPEGILGVRSFEKIILKNVYPSIDWVLYNKDGFLEYDFIVHRGGNPANIKLKVNDAEKVEITADGELLMATKLGEVKEKKPTTYDASGKIVETNFKINSDGSIGFNLAHIPLHTSFRIDPEVVWATYYGGDGSDFTHATTSVGANIYTTGSTTSSSGIALEGHQNSYGGGDFDGFIAKFNTQGDRIWTTYYGGEDFDQGQSLAFNFFGNIYVSGYTKSQSSIAFEGFQNTLSSVPDEFGDFSGDAFLAKFNDNGYRIWATYYGGSGNEDSWSCSTDYSNNIYLCGTTSSSEGISQDGFQNSYNGEGDAFLVKFSGDGNRLWSTYYGGQQNENGNWCKVDNSNNVYLVGYTNSSENIAFNGFQNIHAGDNDAFLIKFDQFGNRLWGTYYGSSNWDLGYGCTVDGNNNVYLVGYTNSTANIATIGLQTVHKGGTDIFLTKFSSSGARIWSTYYGGPSEDMGRCVVIDPYGYLYIAGFSMEQSYGSFAAKFNDSGQQIWSNNFLNSSYNIATTNYSGLYLAGRAGGSCYVSRINVSNDCNTPMPLAYKQEFCNPAIVSNLTAVGTNLIWYAEATGGTALTTEMVLSSGIYYVSQTSGSCESARTAVTVIINQCGVTTQLASNFCNTQQNFNNPIYADGISGASKYRFRVEEGNITQIIERNVRYFYVNNIEGYNYDKHYLVSVSYFKDGQWSAYGPACAVSTPSPGLSQLRPEYCGIAVSSFASAIYASHLPMATGYRFRITDGGNTQVIEKTAGYFRINEITGYTYGKTYTIDVATHINGQWGAYGPACTITTSQAVTHLADGYCGITTQSLRTVIYAKGVSQATGYRFRINDGAADHVLTRPQRYFMINQIPGYTYNTTYTVNIAALINGSWTEYGPACTITTPVVPLTQIVAAQCGSTVSSLASNIRIGSVSRVEGYRLRVTDGQQEQILDRPSASFRLNMLSSRAYNVTYTVEVAVLVNGEYEPFGPACTITAVNNVDRPGSADLAVEAEAEITDVTAAIRVTSYPNPYTDVFTIAMDTPSQEKVIVRAFDMNGRLVEDITVSPEELTSQKLGAGYSAGIYSVIVSQGEYQKAFKVVKK